jgi:hypothetical protein
VVTRPNPKKLVGIVTRSDLLATHARRLAAANRTSLQIELRLRTVPFSFRRRGLGATPVATSTGAPDEPPTPVAQVQEAEE